MHVRRLSVSCRGGDELDSETEIHSSESARERGIKIARQTERERERDTYIVGPALYSPAPI